MDDLTQPPPNLNDSSRPESLLGPPPTNAFGSSPDCSKRSNPFRSNAQDVLHQLQQPQMLLPPNLPMPRGAPRPLLEIPTGFNNARPFLGHNPLLPDLDSPVNQPLSPFMNPPRGLGPPPPHLNQIHSPQMNYRNNNPNNNNPSIRGNSPYFRNQKGPMRGSGFRPNFRGGGGNRNW